MKKLTITLLLVNALIWGVLIPTQASANDSTQATVAHIITQKIQGNNVDTSVLEAEMQKLAYQFSLEMVDILEKHLPMILEGLASEIRGNADSAYKCSLLKDTKIADKECS